jgi:secreted trypsin-like serine protease
MRKFFPVIILLSLTVPLLSQKVSVQLKKYPQAADSEWQILDSGFLPVASGNDFPGLDSVSLGLDENKRYFLQVTRNTSLQPDEWLYRLYVNTEAVLLVKSEKESGDLLYSFFTGVRKPVSKITGGTAADISNYPWQVYFVAGNYSCGGSIISGNWVITAAHCTEDGAGNSISASSMYVIVGANNPRSGNEGKVYTVSKYIRHANYDPKTLNDDIALLQINGTINYTNAKPVRLVSKIDSAAGATDPGVMSWVTGYGLIDPSPQTYPTTLQQVQLPVISNIQASTVWTDIAPSDIMAGYRSGNKDACNGDSGGPLVVPVENEYKLAGLVSWGSSSCDTYGAYTRISLFEDWINTNTGIEISYVPPVPSGDSIVCQGVATSSYSVPVIANATGYEWVLIPAEAGFVSGSLNQASVTWTQGFTGAATLRLRVTKYGFPSYWSSLTIHIARYNKLISQSADTVICAGQPVTLSVNSEGYNLNYSWFRNSTFISSGKLPELPLKNTSTSISGPYRCDISGSCGDLISAGFNLTILPVTAIQTLSPDNNASFGDNVNLEVSADGHELLYQWNKDGQIIDNATLPQYTLSNVNSSNTGLYNVDISGTCGEIVSRNVYVYVSDNKGSAEPKLLVWPTVSSNEINVALSTDEEYEISIYTVSGRLIRELRKCRYKTTLSVADQAAGIYLVEVAATGFRQTVKIIRN